MESGESLQRVVGKERGQLVALGDGVAVAEIDQWPRVRVVEEQVGEQVLLPRLGAGAEQAHHDAQEGGEGELVA